ncbi:MAG: Flp family type IVb pilin [Pseudorhodoplanes sp.]|nr:Flp family type IVb pilin [Pseudorhodoplanes sp.]MCL4710118.1 Flp family type IVb pilin [Pseudorhodoplanes sp.]MCQ3942427.1 Flp family type IVb pilin [Alphaproteobacteria bacterium]MCZ7643378.1 Flp family type IVb pilin [Pseudorhodoplanes sp.]
MFRSIIARPLQRFIADRNAATSIDYAVIAAGVGALIAATVTIMGTSLNGMYDAVKSAWPG